VGHVCDMECNEWRYSAGIESWSRRIEEVVPLSYTVSSKSPHPEAVGYSVLNADPPILGSILCVFISSSTSSHPPLWWLQFGFVS